MNWVQDISIPCRQCGEEFSIQIETVAHGKVEIIEDCAVCCRPMLFRVTLEDGEVLDVEIQAA